MRTCADRNVAAGRWGTDDHLVGGLLLSQPEHQLLHAGHGLNARLRRRSIRHQRHPYGRDVMTQTAPRQAVDRTLLLVHR